MKKTQQKQQEAILSILKPIAKRIEEATVDIHEMKTDLKWVNLRLSNLEGDTKIMKVDIIKVRGDIDNMRGDMNQMRSVLEDKLIGIENRLHKRITNVADLIAMSLVKEFKTVDKRIRKIELAQQPA
ncbi:MAG: hypothetical protein HYT07_03830 [Candidatus Levybacteria bacterium]|nr:hypothetical protein [Candidatus Levybacteria bacterium]